MLSAAQLRLAIGGEAFDAIPDAPAKASDNITGFRPAAVKPKRYAIKRSPDQRSPDRAASIKRRRQHAATGPLPPPLASGYTTGQLACLCIVADEFLAHGVCDLSLNEIAARAGTCKSIAKRAMWLAEHADTLIAVERRPRSGRKHLTNLTRIVRVEWLDWLVKGNRKGRAVAACHRAKPDFARARGLEKHPPRAPTDLRKETGAGPDGPAKRSFEVEVASFGPRLLT